MNKNIYIYLGAFVGILILGIFLFSEIDYKNSLNSNETLPTSQDDYNINLSSELEKNGIFKDYYSLAYNKLNSLSLDEKIGQLFLVRYPESDIAEIINTYHLGGFVFYEKDFTNKTKNDVVKMMNTLQDLSSIPLLTAVDEEGGKVVRISSNPNLISSRFESPSSLYDSGGFDLIRQDTIKKSELLSSLGINLNLAPVVDVSTNSSSYIYERTLKQNTELTSTFAKTVIEASKGGKVSYTLKHFPGYGNNGNTHDGSSIDNRTSNDLKDNDLPPFEAGIKAGAEAILVSHNTVTAMDSNNPASLSEDVHQILRNDLGFTGIIISDDLAMGAVSSIDNAVVKAVLAGNDLIIVTDFQSSIEEVKEAVNDRTINEEIIDKAASRVLAWKYYKGLMLDKQK